MEILNVLQSEPYNFKLKDTSNIGDAVHLGSSFLRDKDGTLTMNPNHYLKRMEDSYERLFSGEAIDGKVKSPLDSGDHPELNTSEFLKGDNIIIYQSLIGAFQWAVSIGRWDIMTAVMTLSSFYLRSTRVGHLNRVKRVYAYLLNHQYYRIRFDVRKPNHNTTPVHTYNWSNTAYDTIAEEQRCT